MNHLRVVLQVLKEHQLFSKYSKYEVLLRLVTFHDHIISSEGGMVDLRKTEEVKNFLRPLTLTDIRIFLGFAGYYRRFVEGFASIEHPLTILTQRCKKF